MSTQGKYKKSKIVLVILMVILPATYISYYQFIYHPLFSWRKVWFSPPRGNLVNFRDGQRNAGIIDHPNNMILILALPNHHKSKPISDSCDGFVIWMVMPKSKSFAEFYSEYGHVVGVRRHKNSFVVVDGMTGEELLVHPITIEEREQWRKDAPRFKQLRQDGDYYDNLLEGSFEFFSLPREKFHEINEKIQQHDTSNEREKGIGFTFRDGKIEVIGP